MLYYIIYMAKRKYNILYSCKDSTKGLWDFTRNKNKAIMVNNSSIFAEMERYMKFIHCADIHLDSNLETNFDKAVAATRRNELLMTFVDMVKFAIKAEIKGIIIAGDLFDSEYVSVRTREVIINCIEKNPQIDFLYLRGNHDEASFLNSQNGFANLKLLGEDDEGFRYDNVFISGSLKHNFNENDFNIVVLHGELKSFGNLAGRNADYYAMGHIHRHMVGRIDSRSEYCYSGCLEARGFDECTKTGFVILDINSNTVKKEFVRFGRRNAHCISVTAPKAAGTVELVELIEKALVDISQKDMVKVVLEGDTITEFNADFSYIEQHFKEKYFAFRIEDQTSLQVDLESIKSETSLKGAFVRMVLQSSEDEELKKEIVRCGLEVMAGEVTKKWL